MDTGVKPSGGYISIFIFIFIYRGVGMYGFAPASTSHLLFLWALLFANTKKHRYLATGRHKPSTHAAFKVAKLVSRLLNR
jgi:hypothetical protein